MEREFLDFARSLEEGGLDKLTVTKVRPFTLHNLNANTHFLRI